MVCGHCKNQIARFRGAFPMYEHLLKVFSNKHSRIEVVRMTLVRVTSRSLAAAHALILISQLCSRRVGAVTARYDKRDIKKDEQSGGSLSFAA